MSELKFDSAILSDLSANVLAVLLLIIIILLHALPPAQGSAIGANDSLGAIEATSDLAVVRRAPLKPAGMIDLLYDRRPGAKLLRVDLHDDRIEIETISEGGLRLDPSREGAATAMRIAQLAREAPAGDVALVYVFSNRWHALAVAALRRGNLAWREISAPAALRRAHDMSQSDGWSDAFLAVLARASDRDAFQRDLAELLAGSTKPGGAPGRSGAPAAAGAASTQESALQRFMRRLGLIFGLAATLSGVVIALTIETLVPRAKRSYDRGDFAER